MDEKPDDAAEVEITPGGSPASPGALENLKKLALSKSPELLQLFSWQSVSDEYAPFVREQNRIMNLKPRQKR